MKTNYLDIISRIEGPPLWYDQNGTPRYDEFHPEFCPNIYSNEVVLLRIECQDCGLPLDVEMHSSFWQSLGNPKKLHYGDPPAHGCVGDTMNCDDIEVLQAWRRVDFEWERVREFEGRIE